MRTVIILSEEDAQFLVSNEALLQHVSDDLNALALDPNATAEQVILKLLESNHILLDSLELFNKRVQIHGEDGC